MVVEAGLRVPRLVVCEYVAQRRYVVDASGAEVADGRHDDVSGVAVGVQVLKRSGEDGGCRGAVRAGRG